VRFSAVEPPDPRGPAVVAGATSIVGRYLLPRLLAAGYDVHAVSRRAAPAWSPPGVSWHSMDIADAWSEAPSEPFLVHLAPLWLAPPLISNLLPRGLRRVVAFGSTSRFTKARSRDPDERALAARLAAAETAVESACETAGVPWTVFRPTLIYGGEYDRSLATVAAFVRRFGFFPVAGDGRGLRQPVHADDLAGGTTLSYRHMVVRVFEGLGRTPRIVSLPLAAYRAALKIARCLPQCRNLSPAMADRMASDLCFDATDAGRDLAYSPRPFSYSHEP
jgi:nucleoside-diphosphate-sugar epimerase